VVERAQGTRAETTALALSAVPTVVGAMVEVARAEARAAEAMAVEEPAGALAVEMGVAAAGVHRMTRTLRKASRGTRRRQHQCTAHQTRRRGTRSAP